MLRLPDNLVEVDGEADGEADCEADGGLEGGAARGADTPLLLGNSSEALLWDVAEHAAAPLLLRACKAAAAAAPSAVPLQLMHARELLRHGAALEALHALQVTALECARAPLARA